MYYNKATTISDKLVVLNLKNKREKRGKPDETGRNGKKP